MAYTVEESDDALTLHPRSTASAAVIWLHGLGADGYDFVPIVEELQLPATLNIRFVFPHAAYRPVTINNGYVMRAWYDIRGFSPDSPEDVEGIGESARVVGAHIEQQARAGIPPHRIVLAGFSQGGAIALHTGVRRPESLCGILALSTYLPLRAALREEGTPANRGTPILMCHGDTDGVVPLSLGALSRQLLTEAGYAVEWKSYPMAHQVSPQEVADIAAWLKRQLGTNRPGTA